MEIDVYNNTIRNHPYERQLWYAFLCGRTPKMVTMVGLLRWWWGLCLTELKADILAAEGTDGSHLSVEGQLEVCEEVKALVLSLQGLS